MLCTSLSTNEFICADYSFVLSWQKLIPFCHLLVRGTGLPVTIFVVCTLVVQFCNRSRAAVVLILVEA